MSSEITALANICFEYGMPFFGRDRIFPLLSKIDGTLARECGDTLKAAETIIKAYPQYTGDVNQALALIGYDTAFDEHGKCLM